jgi:negative regulator of sigma E activity
MSEQTDLERRLRSSLRAVDPGAGFTPRVMARIAAEPVPVARTPRVGAVASWLTFGLAASVVLAVLLAHEWQVRRLEQGREARRQLIEALRVTDEKLNLTYRVVNSREDAAPPAHSGA